MTELTAGESTCPICGITWRVTPQQDCLMPGCGCFGHDTTAANPARPCGPCGLRHAMNWVKKGYCSNLVKIDP
jgi:hypothetical protein